MNQKILLAFFSPICFCLTENHRAFAQVNIAINTPVATNTNTASFQVSITPPALTQGQGFNIPPFQEIFWILGDGDFYRDLIQYGPNAPYINSFNYSKSYYRSASGANYTVQTLIKDRKTDNPPPSRIFSGYNPPSSNSFDLPFNTGVPPGGDDFINYTFSNSVFNFSAPPAGSLPKKVGLTNSHLFTPPTGSPYCFIEDFAQTVFVLGFSPRHTGKLLFFYRDGMTANDDFDDAYASFKPLYGIATLNGPISPNTNLTDYQIGAGPFDYNKTLEYNITNEDLLIDNPEQIEGLRLFYGLTANDIDEQLQGGYPFMVMLTSDNSQVWNSIGEQNFLGGDDFFVSKYVDAGSGKIGSTDLYFVDADTLYLKGGEPKDPNRLIVTNICKCGDNDYLVSFELIYCNESNVETGSANILIKDNNNLFRCFRLTPTEPFACSEPPTAGAALSEWNKRAIRCNNAGYEGWDLRYYASNCTLAIDANTTIGIENCARFRFTARTNAEGLTSLLSKGALSACVELHEVVCDRVCCESTLLDTALIAIPGDTSFTFVRKNPGDWLIWQGMNGGCQEMPCECCCKTVFCELIEWLKDHPLISAAIAIVVIIIVYYLLRIYYRAKRKDTGG